MSNTLGGGIWAIGMRGCICGFCKKRRMVPVNSLPPKSAKPSFQPSACVAKRRRLRAGHGRRVPTRSDPNARDSASGGDGCRMFHRRGEQACVAPGMSLDATGCPCSLHVANRTSSCRFGQLSKVSFGHSGLHPEGDARTTVDGVHISRQSVSKRALLLDAFLYDIYITGQLRSPSRSTPVHRCTAA